MQTIHKEQICITCLTTNRKTTSLQAQLRLWLRYKQNNRPTNFSHTAKNVDYCDCKNFNRDVTNETNRSVEWLSSSDRAVETMGMASIHRETSVYPTLN